MRVPASSKRARVFCCAHPDWVVSSIPDRPDPSGDAEPVRRAVLTHRLHPVDVVPLSTDAFVAAGLPKDTPAILLKFPGLEARPKVFEETPEWAKRLKPFDERST
ncbi:hypothetical protein V8E52_009515 [Russula decolorans]|jgi:hypothetical protein